MLNENYILKLNHFSYSSAYKISSLISGLPSYWQTGIEAAFGSPINKYIYVFKGSMYARISDSSKLSYKY